MEITISELLAAKAQVHRSAILEYLNAVGIMGGEKNPTGHLAAFMSDRRHLYTSDGKGNFRLKGEVNEATLPLGLGIDKEAAE